MKIMWYSNAPWAGTGYGQQTDLFTKLTRDAGHDVAVTANFGLNGAPRGWEGMVVYPGGYDAWANDVIPLHTAHHLAGQPGLVVTLCDVWVLQGKFWKEYPVMSWVPVDHTPTPPKVLKYFEDTGAIPLAMSRFGELELQRVGLEPSYCPHGIDTDLFRPMFELDGVPVRQMLDLPDDAFVVGMNAANKGNNKIRKSFPQAFLGFSMLLRKRPDAILYVHAERYGHAQGVDLVRLADACGIPSDRIRFTDTYMYKMGLSPALLSTMYSAFDVLLAPSMGEGFGIPVIEAQACGVPVVVSDFSAQPELVGSGWKVGGVPDWDEAQAAWLHLPDAFEIAASLDAAYDGQGDSEQARRFALQYDHRAVYQQYMVPALERGQLRVDEVEAHQRALNPRELPDLPDIPPIGGSR